MIINQTLSSQLWKTGGRKKGRTGKRKEKRSSTRPFLAREPNSSTAPNYEPASQMLEKGKLLYWSNLDIFHVIRIYHWERLDWERIHSICNCLFSVFPRNSFPSFSESHCWPTCTGMHSYSSTSVAPKPDIQDPAGKQSGTILSQFFPQQRQEYWINLMEKPTQRCAHFIFNL